MYQYRALRLWPPSIFVTSSGEYQMRLKAFAMNKNNELDGSMKNNLIVGAN